LNDEVPHELFKSFDFVWQMKHVDGQNDMTLQ